MIFKEKASRSICPRIIVLLFLSIYVPAANAQQKIRAKTNFNGGWKFYLGDERSASTTTFDDNQWRKLDLPHDWSIELPFDSTSPTGNGGGALRGGLAWYRKTFTLPLSLQSKLITIAFDGIYRNSEVWINGHYLGERPNGYISFEYDITPYIKRGTQNNVLAVRVDNSMQPNSRWYSGSGIYRNVWLVSKEKISVSQWGTFITTPQVSSELASVVVNTNLINKSGKTSNVRLVTAFFDAKGKKVTETSSHLLLSDSTNETQQKVVIKAPVLWSDKNPYLYKAVTSVFNGSEITDVYETTFGIRYFKFDRDKGFLLNGKHVRIKGVCNHHDLGCLGTAINYRALERQMEILKTMGCNAFRTSHNAPAPELLELADKMGFIIMDEAFDMWKKEKSKFDYHLDWDQWHVKDLQDQVRRDRNHPSVFIWSVGNEIPEQWSKNEDSSGGVILRELHAIVKGLDSTRPTVTANNEINPWNKLLQANVTDLIGYNYSHTKWQKDSISQRWGSKPFIATESVSALATRGYYETIPSDSIRRWPSRWDKPCDECNKNMMINAYDNVSTPWGSTHEETMKVFLKSPNVSGHFIWTGFDYIGEPRPFPFPARSSYFGIIDLAGFPKDVYYMYQSVWTDKTMLHIFPHWNWLPGDVVDVWAYYSNADEVELFLNGKSLGTRKKTGDDLHVMWRVNYEAGSLKVISRKNGRMVLSKEVKTAGKPVKIILSADRNTIKADNSDLSFITATIVDAEGNMVPYADNLIEFTSKGDGEVIATDNGLQTSLESFRNNKHKAFNGLCLGVFKAGEKTGEAVVTASASGLASGSVIIKLK